MRENKMRFLVFELEVVMLTPYILGRMEYLITKKITEHLIMMHPWLIQKKPILKHAKLNSWFHLGAGPIRVADSMSTCCNSTAAFCRR